MKEIIIATSNSHKIDEFKRILKGIKISSLKDIGYYDEIEEDGNTFEENALIKARTVAEKIGKTVIADDSGLEIYALNNEPGIYSARYLGHDTPYEVKNSIIIDRLKNVPEEERGARFVCCIAMANPDGSSEIFRGEFDGYIAHKPAGENGFGYDPIFYLPEYGMTAAELEPDVKNSISHRGKAIQKLFEKLRGN